MLGPERHRVRKPVVCAVNGMAAGGAMYFINESDIVIEQGVRMSGSVATEQLLRFALLIGGAEVVAASGKTYQSLDPYTG
ncbi:hypothetical protein [Nocardia jiangxiensis]|uniref:hypothetical protein n=1 Tax=Nocardia jiangxiensis TaxID=282685 RepID=UPI000594651B|nr:hypothetical protein [Nocardia jiangxiensis]